MHLRYPVNVNIKADMDIALLMSNSVTNHQMHYCPVMAALRKAGRPRSEGRIRGALEKRSKKSRS